MRLLAALLAILARRWPLQIPTTEELAELYPDVEEDR